VFPCVHRTATRLLPLTRRRFDKTAAFLLALCWFRFCRCRYCRAASGPPLVCYPKRRFGSEKALSLGAALFLARRRRRMAAAALLSGNPRCR
jgi:hypothetical protein